MTNEEIAQEIIAKLGAVNISAFIFKRAQTGSIYIHFKDSKLGKMRVGDHKEKNCLGYRWQLRTDLVAARVQDSKGHRQFLYPEDEIGNLVAHIRNYYKKIAGS